MPVNAYEECKATLLRLDEERKGIEHEIKELIDLLGPVGMKESLIDADGFPRSDVDVYQVRHQRNRVSCLQSDHKQKMRELEEQLSKLHTLAPPVMTPELSPSASTSHSNGSGSNAAAGGGASSVSHSAAGTPFAAVDEVTPGSPAAEAGLLVGDAIVLFGSLRCMEGVPRPTLAEVGGTVRAREGQPTPVHVLRAHAGGQGQREVVQLTLTPRRWSGQGLLGCHITAMQDRCIIFEGHNMQRACVCALMLHT